MRKIIFIYMLIIFMIMSCDNNSVSYKLNTNAAVKKAYKDITGKDYSSGEIIRPKGITGVIILNEVAPDMGSVFLGIFVKKKWYSDRKKGIQAALLHMGWNQKAANRTNILRKFLTKTKIYGAIVSKAVNSPMAKKQNTKINPPIFKATENGGIKAIFQTITGWNIEGRPMYSKYTLLFDENAKVNK